MPSPLAEVLIEEVAEELLSAFLQARSFLEAELTSFLTDPVDRARRTVRIGELLGTIEQATAGLEIEARRWAERRLPQAYQLGARGMADDLGVDWPGWSTLDIDAVTTLATDTFEDVLEVTQNMDAGAKRIVREVGRGVLPAGQVAGMTAVQQGRAIADLLEARGVTTVVYANGARFGVDTYADMLARTKSALAHNTGGFVQARTWGVEWLECFDGPACGWASHYDLEPAHGKIVTVNEAADVPIGHPNCARSFGPRPDLKGRPAREGPTVDEVDAATTRLSAQGAEARTRIGAARIAGTPPAQVNAVTTELWDDAGVIMRGIGTAEPGGRFGVILDEDMLRGLLPEGHGGGVGAVFPFDGTELELDLPPILFDEVIDLDDLAAVGEAWQRSPSGFLLEFGAGTKALEVTGRVNAGARWTGGRFRFTGNDGRNLVLEPIGTHWPAGDHRLRSGLDLIDEDVLDVARAYRVNPWSPAELAAQRERERILEQTRRISPRRSTRRRRPDLYPLADATDIDRLDLPAWAQGTAIEDAKRLADGEGYLPFIDRTPGANTGMLGHGPDGTASLFDDIDGNGPWIGYDGRLAARGRTHQQVLEAAGEAIDDEVMRRVRADLRRAKTRAVSTTQRELNKVRRQVSQTLEDMDEFRIGYLREARANPDFLEDPQRYVTAMQHHPRYIEINTLHDELAVQASELTQELIAAERATATLYAQHARQVMAELRQMGGTITFRGGFVAREGYAGGPLGLDDDAYRNLLESRGRPVPPTSDELMAEVAGVYPSSWLKASDRYVTTPNGLHSRALTFGGWTDRASMTGTGNLMLSPTDRGLVDTPIGLSTAMHEFGHRIESVVPTVRASEWAFYDRRTRLADGTQEDLKRLDELRPGHGYTDDEFAREDRFTDPYMGKAYGSDMAQSWELFTMGIEGLFTGTHGIVLGDPDYRRWMLGTLYLA